MWRSEGIASPKLITVDKGAGTVCASLQVADTDRVCAVGKMGDRSGGSTALGRSTLSSCWDCWYKGVGVGVVAGKGERSFVRNAWGGKR